MGGRTDELPPSLDQSVGHRVVPSLRTLPGTGGDEMKYILLSSIIVGISWLWWSRVRCCADLADVVPEPVQTDMYLEDLWLSLFERELA